MVSNGIIDLNTAGNLCRKGCVYFLKSKFNLSHQPDSEIVNKTLI